VGEYNTVRADTRLLAVECGVPQQEMLRRMTATIRPAALALAALLLIAGCGGSASPGHTARSALSCQQQSARIRDLAAAYSHDANFGDIAKSFAELHAARAVWDSMHKKHCPASSYAQANQALRTYAIHF
jgi:hypothetical protein